MLVCMYKYEVTRISKKQYYDSEVPYGGLLSNEALLPDKAKCGILVHRGIIITKLL